MHQGTISEAKPGGLRARQRHLALFGKQRGELGTARCMAMSALRGTQYGLQKQKEKIVR